MICYIPESFKAAQFFKKSNDQRKAIYIVHQIESQRVMNRRQRETFTLLHSYLLRKQLGRYKHVIDVLVREGIVVCDNHYVIGQKCKGYALSEQFKDVPFVKTDVSMRTAKLRHTRPVHKHLAQWLTQLTSTSTDDTNLPLLMIRDKQFFYTPDQYGRCHTNLTNLVSAARQYLRIHDEPLVSFDIVNSQPYFLLLSYLNSLSSYPVLINVTSTSSPPSPFHYVAPKVEQYAELVTQGQLYEALTSTGQTRDEVKNQLFRETLFGKGVSRTFERLFTPLADYIKRVKKKDHRLLSHQMQRQEAKTVIHEICASLMVNEPDLPILTIHDSFITTRSRAKDLGEFLSRHMSNWTYKPTLREERWFPS